MSEKKLLKNEKKFTKTNYPNLDKILDQKITIRGFRSGGGLRVIRLENKKYLLNNLKGYGEHPNVITALSYADYSVEKEFSADYYSEFYGKVVPNYWTGQSNPVNKLDHCLLQGHRFFCNKKYGKAILEIHGYSREYDGLGEKVLFTISKKCSFTEILKEFENEYKS